MRSSTLEKKSVSCYKTYTMSGSKKAAKKQKVGKSRTSCSTASDCLTRITKPDIRRVARRGGVQRISGLVYEETRDQLQNFLDKVTDDVIALLDNNTRKRKTITVNDVLYALTLYGYGEIN